MHTSAGHRRALLALLVAVLAALASVLLLSRAADAIPCTPTPTTLEGCEPIGPSTTSTTRGTTSTTEDDDRSTTTTDDVVDDDDEPTSTTTRRTTGTAQPEIVTTTTRTVTTLHDVLIPGDGTAGAESTTTTAPPTVGADSGLSDEQLIAIIVLGFGVVGLVAAVLTWRYWSATRPRVVEVPARSAGPSVARSVFLE